MDVLTKSQRRINMQHIRSKNTTIEIILRKALWHKGLRYRKNCNSVFGKPDIVIKKYKLAIFCDGSFWHGGQDISRCSEFWQEKIKRNKERDLEVTIRLRDEGWTVLRFTDKDIMENTGSCVDCIMKQIRNNNRF